MNTALALIFWEDKILLFHRDNIPTIPNPDCWALPGGIVENGETPIQGLKRELLEEVTYLPKKLEFVGSGPNENGFTTYIYITFVGQAEVGSFKHGIGEGKEIAFFTLDEALNLKLAPVLRRRLESSLDDLKKAVKNKTVPKMRI